LSDETRSRAQISEMMVPFKEGEEAKGRKGLPEDRWNPFDERHLGGAHQDNRTVPYGECMTVYLYCQSHVIC
jgi:hypothetical protein